MQPLSVVVSRVSPPKHLPHSILLKGEHRKVRTPVVGAATSTAHSLKPSWGAEQFAAAVRDLGSDGQDCTGAGLEASAMKQLLVVPLAGETGRLAEDAPGRAELGNSDEHHVKFGINTVRAARCEQNIVDSKADTNTCPHG